MGIVIQFGVFDELDDFAVVELGKRWLRVPAWLVCEWEGDGGVYGIVREYNLEQWTIFRPYEYRAMKNIRDQARAMRRFYLYGDTGTLSAVERRCLDVEADTRANYPHLRGDAMYEHIATHMGTDYTPRQVRAILEDATDVLRQQESEIEDAYYAKLAKRIAKITAAFEVAA